MCAVKFYHDSAVDRAMLSLELLTMAASRRRSLRSASQITNTLTRHKGAALFSK